MLHKQFGHFCVSKGLLEPILEQPPVIRRKQHRLGHTSVSPNLYAAFVKLQSMLLQVQNLENGPTRIIKSTRDSVRYNRLGEPDGKETQSCGDCGPCSLAKWHFSKHQPTLLAITRKRSFLNIRRESV